MPTGLQSAGVFAEEEEAARSAASRAALAQALVSEVEENTVGAPPQIERMLLGALLAAATLWLIVVIWVAFADPNVGPLSPSGVAKGIAYACSPLVLLGIAALLLLRTSRREAVRFANVAAIVRAESIGLNTALSLISNRLAADRAAIAETAEKLMVLADETSEKLTGAHGLLAQEMILFATQAKKLDDAASAARLDMGVLLADLPRAENQTREMAEILRTAGLNAHEQAAALDGTIASLLGRAREGEEAASAAANRLAAHVARIEGLGEVSARRIDDAGISMAASIDGVLARAAQALEQTREGVAAQGEAMLTLIGQAGAALNRAGADSAASLAERIEGMNGEIAKLTVRLAEQDEASRTMLSAIEASVVALEARLAALDAEAPARTASIADTLERLAAEAARINVALAEGGGASASLLAGADALRERLAACLDELNGTLPRALNALEAQAEHSRGSAQAAAPEVERLAAAAGEAAAHVAAIEGRIGVIGSQVDAATNGTRALGGEIGEAHRTASALGETAGSALVEALARVRETAAQAAQRAKEAFAEVIPASASMLATETGAALDQVMGEKVEAQLDRVAALSDKAIAAAGKAADRLSRQLDGINSTANAIESRVDEAKAAVDAADRESFSRRAALLIEALNSNAIVIAKALSADVGDEAWDAYLKGDRGAFTRRAVKLLDATEARQIGKLYESDVVFKEQVNRYVHDFEAMLRPIVANKDGGALGVALLSSDMGKLYVALAQGIERIKA
ncbi:MAG: hypothetical protein JOY99_04310 [Sphingomonadaceae bacterium]|nr:hypothetical protein [Sphingomonadaceae bacterium]